MGPGERLSRYLITPEDPVVGPGAHLVSETTGDGGAHAASREWVTGAGTASVPSSTRVEAAVYDPVRPDHVFDSASRGWRGAGSPGIGERSSLLVVHPPGDDGMCGYRVVLQRGGLVAVVSVRTQCASLTGGSGGVRSYALELARRQETLLRGYPSAA
ncbi:MAG: hypothetical protein MAG715_00118 [Methanonatronarchaeales archaeon]|nr:hypothetical protein [Methanonatronarchaeales archaeon]